MYRLLALIPVVAIACSKSDSATAKATGPCAKAKAHGTLAWIEDDYPAALACAKARNVPVVLDLWAPWCHTCLSMQATVFTDPSFQADASKFVFAALDTDRETNAAAVAKFPMPAWPTFYVITPDEAVLARFVGAASVPQFHAFLDAGRTALAGVEGAGKHLLAADRALAAKDLATGETELAAALAQAPADWVRKPDVLTSLLQTKRKRGDIAGCVELATASLDQTGNTASAADFVGIALDCASSAKVDPAQATALRDKALARLRQLLDDKTAQLSLDDRSDAMIYLREALDAAGKKDEAIAIALAQRTLLDGAAAQAADARAAMTYNWHLAEVYVYLKRPLEAVPALEKSAAALPTEYDPPARLGWVYLKAEKYAEAATWTDKALALAYGPRKARVLGQRAEIAAKQGDLVAEKKYRQDTVALWSSLPPGQANPEALAKAREALAKLDAPPAPPAPVAAP